MLLSASILSADLGYLADELQGVSSAGIDAIHLDIMDNHYVPNLSFGPGLCSVIKRSCPNLPMDVHLMVKPVEALIEVFATLGAHQISFHPDATHHVDRNLQLIRSYHCKAGLAINPATDLSCLNYVWERLDFILIMSVNPGFSGQVFIDHSLQKVQHAHRLIKQFAPSVRLAVDGGVNLTNIAQLARAGADYFVLGSALFGQKDYLSTVQKFRDVLHVTPRS